METQLDSFLFMFLFLVVFIPSIIIMDSIRYRIGVKKANDEIKKEAEKLINKINNTLIKHKETIKELNLVHDAICSKQKIKNLEKEINIEKCKLMLTNTEIENLKKIK